MMYGTLKQLDEELHAAFEKREAARKEKLNANIAFIADINTQTLQAYQDADAAFKRTVKEYELAELKRRAEVIVLKIEELERELAE
mgnify:CR=1 FL=1